MLKGESSQPCSAKIGPNNSGYVLPPLGGTIGGLGAIGMIAFGIVLGMSNKRKL